jgi:DNA relaxase NicK
MTTKIVGGGSNTHPSDTYRIKSTDTDVEEILDKSFVIDWISYTFDNVMYDETYNKETFKKDLSLAYSKTNDYILNNLLMIFNINKPWQQLEFQDYALNGYRFSWEIGEHIKINFAGAKSGRNLPTTQLLLSGQACREFENHYGGKYFVLFDFLTKTHEELSGRTFNGHFKRLDIAIDDFTGKEINIYDLRDYADNGHWVGSYQSCVFYYSNSYRGGISSKGYSLTFGSPSSNQLQIYDKKLEQESKNKKFVGSDVWYRYEMRFVNPRADKVVSLYQKHYIDRTLNQLAFQLLKSSIDFKVVSSDSNKSRVETLPEWDLFCNHLQKIDLKQNLPDESSWEKTKKWIDHNLKSIFTQLVLVYGNEVVDEMIKLAECGSEYINEKTITKIERYLEKSGKKPLTTKVKQKMLMKGLKVDYETMTSK